jgi:hypothetical protein
VELWATEMETTDDHMDWPLELLHSVTNDVDNSRMRTTMGCQVHSKTGLVFVCSRGEDDQAFADHIDHHIPFIHYLLEWNK